MQPRSQHSVLSVSLSSWLSQTLRVLQVFSLLPASGILHVGVWGHMLGKISYSCRMSGSTYRLAKVSTKTRGAKGKVKEKNNIFMSQGQRSSYHLHLLLNTRRTRSHVGDWVYSQRGEVVNGLSTFSKETFHSKNCTLNICSLQGTADGHTDMARFPFFFSICSYEHFLRKRTGNLKGLIPESSGVFPLTFPAL